MIKANSGNMQFMKKALADIEKIEEFKKMANAYIKDNVIYENLSFYLAGKYVFLDK